MKGVIGMAKVRTRRCLVTLGAASALVVGGMTGFAPAAQADTSGCPANRFCLFEHDDFEGGREVFKRTDVDLRNNYWNGTTNTVSDNASSMINNTGHKVTLWDGHGCGGYNNYVAKAESDDTDFTNNGNDNRITCVEFP
jgi:hypothetical protein